MKSAVNAARRSFLRLLGGAPAAVAALDLQTKLAAHGVASLSDRGIAGMPASMATPESEPLRFTDFGQWWERFGLADARQAARDVHAFDPDILSMGLPLATKVRMQRERNFARLEEARREWFERSVSLRGAVGAWL